MVSQLTLEEKLKLLSTDLGVERLDTARCGSMEGLHGLALGGPAAKDTFHTTIFPQAYGLGETWDRECVKAVGRLMAEEDVAAALDDGLIAEEDIDRVIKGNLLVALKLGLLDDPDGEWEKEWLHRWDDVLRPYKDPKARELDGVEVMWV